MTDRMLQLLVFDLGHVVVDFDWDELCAGFERASNKSRRELAQTFHYCWQLGYETGRINTAGFLAELNRGLGTNMSAGQFRDLWVATFCENNEMAELLSLLKEQCPLYMLSNTNELHFQHVQEQYNVSRHFQELILSYEFGCAKPNPLIYEEILRRSGLPAQKCLFVDDLEMNIRGAQEVGLETIHFTGIADLKERLSSLGFYVC
jgi:glucose-1-phosphatase